MTRMAQITEELEGRGCENQPVAVLPGTYELVDIDGNERGCAVFIDYMGETVALFDPDAADLTIVQEVPPAEFVDQLVTRNELRREWKWLTGAVNDALRGELDCTDDDMRTASNLMRNARIRLMEGGQ